MINKSTLSDRILESRKKLAPDSKDISMLNTEAEGGCGVTGFACNIPVRGKHILIPSIQMNNRGNGKGGGIAAAGLDPNQLGISRDILENNYLLQIALLEPNVQSQMEKEFIEPNFEVKHSDKWEVVDDYRDIKGLEIKPPDVVKYFVKIKDNLLDDFIRENNLKNANRNDIEDEFIFQNSFKLNKKYYASLGEKEAFVLSHGKNILVFKIVGYAEHIVQYYKLEDMLAHVWIAHQRYPTKGRVWHPGGAHPFSGLNEALVHNGDFANYYSVCQYLKQRNIYPLFLTDTEVSVLLFDLMNRVYKYPLEYIIESLAPTTERDFDLLPEEKKQIYRNLQISHIGGSPDGPWFFIIARSVPEEKSFQLMGITDTSMLRPQVFALQDGEVQIGLICSEKQAIDATLRSLSEEDSRFCPIADKYWNARGGSYTDGGAFVFTVKNGLPGNGYSLTCTDKFGKVVDVSNNNEVPPSKDFEHVNLNEFFDNNSTGRDLFEYVKSRIENCDLKEFTSICNEIVKRSKKSDEDKKICVEGLTLLSDLRYSIGIKKRAKILQAVQDSLYEIFESTLVY